MSRPSISYFVYGGYMLAWQGSFCPTITQINAVTLTYLFPDTKYGVPAEPLPVAKFRVNPCKTSKQNLSKRCLACTWRSRYDMPQQIQAPGNKADWLEILRRIEIGAQCFSTKPRSRHRQGHTKHARKAE